MRPSVGAGVSPGSSQVGLANSDLPFLSDTRFLHATLLSLHSEVDLVQFVAPWLAESLDNTKTPIRLLGCQIVGANLQVAKTLDVCFPRMNHWVLGVPIEGHCIDVNYTADGVGGDDKPYADARLAAGKVGLTITETVVWML